MIPSTVPVVAILTFVLLIVFLGWLRHHQKRRTLVTPTVCHENILVLIMILGAIIGVLVTHAPDRNAARQQLQAQWAALFPWEPIDDQAIEDALDGCACYDETEGGG